MPGVHRFVFDTIRLTVFRVRSDLLPLSRNQRHEVRPERQRSCGDRHLRNRTTRFGYNDAMWAKYGKQFSEQLNNFVDPKTKEAPIINIHATNGGTMDRLIKRGVQIAICEVATRGCRISGTAPAAKPMSYSRSFPKISSPMDALSRRELSREPRPGTWIRGVRGRVREAQDLFIKRRGGCIERTGGCLIYHPVCARMEGAVFFYPSHPVLARRGTLPADTARRRSLRHSCRQRPFC